MKPGMLVICHGSREAEWVALVDETVGAARAELGYALTVETVFLELVEGRLIQDGIDRLEEAGVDRIFALPLFVSSGSTHVDEIGWALGAHENSRTETDLGRFRLNVPLDYGIPMDYDAEIVDVLLDRLGELSVEPSTESILLIGHGSKAAGFREDWEAGMAALGEELISKGGYRAFAFALLQLEEVGFKGEQLRARNPGNTILVIPLFLSEGYFTKVVIPRHLGELACHYKGTALMPHHRISDWITRQTRVWLKGIER